MVVSLVVILFEVDIELSLGKFFSSDLFAFFCLLTMDGLDMNFLHFFTSSMLPNHHCLVVFLGFCFYFFIACLHGNFILFVKYGKPYSLLRSLKLLVEVVEELNVEISLSHLVLRVSIRDTCHALSTSLLVDS